MACHGNISRLGPSVSNVRLNEHTTWISDDAHSRAFEVLFGEQSDRIERNLAGARGAPTRAHQDERCAACHTTPRPARVREATAWMNADGVGCESCHGASGNWLGPHTTYYWRDLGPSAKEATGLRNTKDLALRAEICAGCHVGQHADSLTDQDVNHDLIAAGHPRLNFELAAFLENMPRHWEEKGQYADPANRTKRAADFTARAWATGRLVTLKMALELLHARAAQAEATLELVEKWAAASETMPAPLPSPAVTAEKRTAAWPEFTEYGCFSCHHDLRNQAWRLTPRAGAIAPGAPTWGSWTLPFTTDLIAQLFPESVAKSYADSVGVLSKEMAKAVPDPKVIQRETQKLVESLGDCLKTLTSKRWDAGEVQRLIDRLDRRDVWNRVASWDQASQLYLALVPLFQSHFKLATPEQAERDRFKARFERIRSQLQFPPGFDGPSSFDPSRLDPGL
jgi:hypothetical protein